MRSSGFCAISQPVSTAKNCSLVEALSSAANRVQYLPPAGRLRCTHACTAACSACDAPLSLARV
jgi:hypothetical protein